MVTTPCLSILLLTEDSGCDSHETLRALVKKMLLLVDPACQTQPQRLELCPQPEHAARAMHANIWKSRSPRDRFKLVDLRETIATKLLEEDGFVFFHFDGDRPWGERTESEWARDRARLDEVVRPKGEVCFKAERNRHLAERGFPVQEVFAADRSFAATVISLLDCEDLCAAIARTAR